MIHVDPRHLAIVRRILQQQIPEYEVWAFGSRVHGRGLKPFSDLDLAVISEQPIDVGRSASLRQALVDSDLPFRVDVVGWANATPDFRDIIRQDHAVIQECR